MNITEKRRAEELVQSWHEKQQRDLSPVVIKVDVPKEIKAEFDSVLGNLNKALKDFWTTVDSLAKRHYIVSDNNSRGRVNIYTGNVVVGQQHPAWKAELDKINSLRDQITEKRDRLVVEIWDNKHTFDSLAKELN